LANAPNHAGFTASSPASVACAPASISANHTLQARAPAWQALVAEAQEYVAPEQPLADGAADMARDDHLAHLQGGTPRSRADS
jgi:hypothetical protein